MRTMPVRRALLAARAALAVLAALTCSPALSTGAAGNHPLRVPDTMAQRVLACTGCHGAQGRASNEGFIPRIAGKPASYLQRQLQSFRDGGRRHEGMARLLDGLPDAYLLEIAGHFASLHLPPEQPPRRPLTEAATRRAVQLVREGDPRANVPACNACHGERLGGLASGVPGLAGLPRDYMVAQLGAWRLGLRQAAAPDCMRTIALALQSEDITALADWLAAQPAAAPAPRPAVPAPVACGGMAAP